MPRPLLLLSLTLLVAGTAIACSDPTFPLLGSSVPKERLAATLTGAAEKPAPVTTNATGSVTVTFMDARTIRYELLVAAIDSVTAAHFHAGGTNDVGPVMVDLYVAKAGSPLGRLTGVLSQGDITRATTFKAPFTFDSLAARLRAGTVYANVHTRTNTGGEIRGQLAKQ